MVWGSGLWVQKVHGCGTLSVSACSLTLLILVSFAFLPFPSSCRLLLCHTFDVRHCLGTVSVVSVISPLLLPYLSSGTWTKACTLKCEVYHRALSPATTPFSLFSSSLHLVFCACLFHQGDSTGVWCFGVEDLKQQSEWVSDAVFGWAEPSGTHLGWPRQKDREFEANSSHIEALSQNKQMLSLIRKKTSKKS